MSECIPCCDFCANADKCVEVDGIVIDDMVTCHVLGEKVHIGHGCDEHFKCRMCRED